MPLGSLFSSVNEVPLATASIAQVHRAVHRKSGKEVVIKVCAVLHELDSLSCQAERQGLLAVCICTAVCIDACRCSSQAWKTCWVSICSFLRCLPRYCSSSTLPLSAPAWSIF
jgi:ABC1 atypical kinase-like domain